MSKYDELFRKPGKTTITIPQHNPIKRAYVEEVKAIEDGMEIAESDIEADISAYSGIF